MSLPRRTPMPPRKKPMKRTGSLKRTGRIKPNAKRKAKTFARVFGSEARVRFVKALPCAVPGCRRRDIQNAHVGSHVDAGTGRRGDADTVAPLCEPHHKQQESRTGAFEDEIGVPRGFLMERAAQVDAAWRSEGQR